MPNRLKTFLRDEVDPEQVQNLFVSMIETVFSGNPAKAYKAWVRINSHYNGPELPQVVIRSFIDDALDRLEGLFECLDSKEIVNGITCCPLGSGLDGDRLQAVEQMRDVVLGHFGFDLLEHFNTSLRIEKGDGNMVHLAFFPHEKQAEFAKESLIYLLNRMTPNYLLLEMWMIFVNHVIDISKGERSHGSA